MFLEQLNLWNFRKFGSTEALNRPPDLSVPFKEGLNLLVGENDSGKTAILDAIKLLTYTRSNEYLRLQYEDFYQAPSTNWSVSKLKITCIFGGLKDAEAKNFVEWLSIREVGGKTDFYLQLVLEATVKDGWVQPYDIRAGSDEEGSSLAAGARDLLKITYLKALRDAETEMSPRRNSRLSQILDSHEAFKDKTGHPLLAAFSEANNAVKDFFKGLDEQGQEVPGHPGKHITDSINQLLHIFFGSNKKSGFEVSSQSLKSILEKLELILERGNNGLGSHNLLFIAAELLLLNRKEFTGLRLALIEEIEAHLHPQAQLRLIEHLSNDARKNNLQLILTSHSPTLASKVETAHIIICKNNWAFSLAPENTQLRKGDYAFLQRFLDATKANLFFAQGVMLVEGDAENLLLPAIARIIGRDFTKYGVSIVNMGTQAFVRYANIFKRADAGHLMGVKVACLTDADLSTYQVMTPVQIEECRAQKAALYDGQEVKTFVSPLITLEYDLAMSAARQDLYFSARLADKLNNSDKYGVTITKYKTEYALHKERYDDWAFQELQVEDIAKRIHTLIASKKLKTMTAQFFATQLEHKARRSSLKDQLINDPYFKYIISAIEYVTEPLNPQANVPANNGE